MVAKVLVEKLLDVSGWQTAFRDVFAVREAVSDLLDIAKCFNLLWLSFVIQEHRYDGELVRKAVLSIHYSGNSIKVSVQAWCRTHLPEFAGENSLIHREDLADQDFKR